MRLRRPPGCGCCDRGWRQYRCGNVNGLTFKGFGVLSANGTSALLMDYKAEHPEAYAELLDILFAAPIR